MAANVGRVYIHREAIKKEISRLLSLKSWSIFNLQEVDNILEEAKAYNIDYESIKALEDRRIFPKYRGNLISVFGTDHE